VHHHLLNYTTPFEGETALFKASQNDHKEAVRILLEANAQKDVLNYEQMAARDVTLDNELDDMLH